MTAPLCLVRLLPNMSRLAAWSAAHKYQPLGADEGYAIHAATTASLGKLAPRPFALHRRPNGETELLGYVAAEPASIAEVAARNAGDAEASSALGLSSIEVRAMPDTWQKGRRLAFNLRARPIVRPRNGRHDRLGEVDAYLHALKRNPDARPEAVYADWLAGRLAGAARVQGVELLGRTSSKVLRRAAAGEPGARKATLVPGPDVTFTGILSVEQPQRFGEILAGGVGRHSAFGFGCLLLSPAGGG
jgi:CRISPR system Cascade subunit CasE